MINTLTDSNGLTFVNLYNDENPILEIGDECYFLFFNSVDFHVPFVGKGRIIYDRFNDTINKHYFISIKEILSSQYIKDKFLYNKPIALFPYNKDTLNVSTRNKAYKFVQNKMDYNFLEENLLRIECFFTRNSLEKIIQLRNDYLKILTEDTEKQLSELSEIKQLY